MGITVDGHTGRRRLHPRRNDRNGTVIKPRTAINSRVFTRVVLNGRNLIDMRLWLSDAHHPVLLDRKIGSINRPGRLRLQRLTVCSGDRYSAPADALHRPALGFAAGQVDDKTVAGLHLSIPVQGDLPTRS